MTAPTQAQLAKWIKELTWQSLDKDNMEFEVRTTCYVRDALLKWAAAAEVEVTTAIVADIANERAAAAEVGLSDEDRWKIEKQVMLEQRRHTIERCAEEIKPGMSWFEAAAAIRALKDKP